MRVSYRFRCSRPYSGLHHDDQPLGREPSTLTSEAIGSPYSLAFDCVGRNMYIANRGEQMSSNIEVIKVDGEVHHRRIILANNGVSTVVSQPQRMTVDFYEG